jgi:hypothetical protein
METGEYKVSLDTLFRVLGIFGMNIGEFFQEAAGGRRRAGGGVPRPVPAARQPGRVEALDFLRFKAQQSPAD